MFSNAFENKMLIQKGGILQYYSILLVYFHMYYITETMQHKIPFEKSISSSLALLVLSEKCQWKSFILVYIDNLRRATSYSIHAIITRKVIMTLPVCATVTRLTWRCPLLHAIPEGSCKLAVKVYQFRLLAFSAT